MQINQAMLCWVLEEREDTCTLLRLTALWRLPGLQVDSKTALAEIARRSP